MDRVVLRCPRQGRQFLSSRAHLLNRGTAEHYRRSLTDGVERVADTFTRTSRPFTGASPGSLAPAISAIDLEQPLEGPRAVLDADRARQHQPRVRGGRQLPLDALDFFIVLRDTLGLSEEVLPVYLEEISSTLSSTAFKLSAPQVSADALTRSGFQEIESGMTEGHPCFIATTAASASTSPNTRQYAPEAGAPVRLLWIAAHRSRATFTSGSGLSYDKLLLSELSGTTLRRLVATLTELRLELDDYYLVPVPPGSGGTSSPSPSRPRSPSAAWSASATATTTTWPRSPSAPSSMPPTPQSTTSRPPSRPSTWASYAARPPST
jgi:hypothetical protein